MGRRPRRSPLGDGIALCLCLMSTESSVTGANKDEAPHVRPAAIPPAPGLAHALAGQFPTPPPPLFSINDDEDPHQRFYCACCGLGISVLQGSQGPLGFGFGFCRRVLLERRGEVFWFGSWPSTWSSGGGGELATPPGSVPIAPPPRASAEINTSRPFVFLLLFSSVAS